MDFSTYNLAQLKGTPHGVLSLAGGLIREIAEAFSFVLPDNPTEQSLFGLVGAVGPHKELQKNIEHVKKVLGASAAVTAVNWLDASGVMQATSGAFFAPGTALPDRFDAVIWTGAVANWQLRRRNLTERLNPASIDKVVLAMGNRKMGVAEHQLVETFTQQEGRQPTEYEFGQAFVVPVLKAAGFSVALILVDSGNGDEVCDAIFQENTNLLKGTVLTVGNAPNLIQGTGQLRAAGQRVNSGFDQNGDQLFMTGDFFPIARKDEPKDTHQNPLSGIGQIVRNAAFLQKAINTL